MDKDQLLAQVGVTDQRHKTARLDLYRAILAAKDGGCSLGEIGLEMSIDRQTVRHHLLKAYEALRGKGDPR